MLEEEKKEEERSLAFLKSVRLEVAAALLVLIVSQENANPLRLFSHFHELQMTAQSKQRKVTRIGSWANLLRPGGEYPSRARSPVVSSSPFLSVSTPSQLYARHAPARECRHVCILLHLSTVIFTPRTVRR